jgi:hypothetical protein
MGRPKPLRMKGKLRSRNVRRKAAVRKQRLLRSKVRNHNHRRYAGVRGVKLRDKKLRRPKLKPHKPTAKRKTYKVKPESGQGMAPLSMSTYLSMY